MADFLIVDENKHNDNGHTEKHNQEPLIQRINNALLSMQKINTKDKAVFYRLLATMTNAGMSLMKSVSVLRSQEKNKVFKSILEKIEVDLGNGANLSDALEKFPGNFEESEIGMIRAGEKTGKLNITLQDLANQIEKLASISGKLKSAMMYPIAIILIVVGVVFLLMTQVVPGLLEIFGDPKDLPDSTKTLMLVSDIFVNYWSLMLIAIIAIVILVLIWKRTPDGHYTYDNIILKIPIFGGINRKLILSKFSRILGGLIASGVSIVESLKITAEAVGNEVYKQRIFLLAEDVSGGIKMHESLDGDKLFPDMMVQMIQVGEETAKLDTTILKVSDFYDEQIDNTVGVINKLLEPFIIVVLATIVGVIALGIMEPIMGIADSVGKS